MTEKPEGPLRRGWTTGACATAATKAAFTALITGTFPDPVTIRLPRGQRPDFALAREELAGPSATAGIIIAAAILLIDGLLFNARAIGATVITYRRAPRRKFLERPTPPSV